MPVFTLLALRLPSSRGRRWHHPFTMAMALAACLFLIVPQADAAPPTASRLFPKNTVAYLSVSNARELQDRFHTTAWGQMLQDPQMKPLADRLRTSALDALKPQEDRLGIKLADLFAVLQGEVAIAVATPAEGQPALLLLADAGEQALAVDALLQATEKALTEAGAERQSETIEGTEIVRFRGSGSRRQSVAFFQKDGWLAAGTNLDLLKNVLAAWNSSEHESLADNESFAAIARSTAGAKGEEPQLSWFVNPIGLVRETGRNNPGAQIGLALVPTLGLDGLLGVGGSMTLAAGSFDAISRIHLLLDNPRGGALAVLAPSTGDGTPEPWVPANVAEYNTLHWDLDTTWTKLAKLVDSFQGEGALKRQAQQRIFDRAELDLEQYLLPVLDGRFSWCAVVEEPITAQSRGVLIGVKLKDAEKAQELVDKVTTKFEANLTNEAYAGKTYHAFKPQEGRDPENVPPKTGFAIVGDYLLVGRATLLEQALAPSVGEAKSLADALDFKLIASKAQRTSGGGEPSLLTFSRPEEGLRFMYGLAVNERTRKRLEDGSQNNAFLGSVNQALKDHPLPPLETLTRYLAPGGAVLVNDETGFRYTSFMLRRTSE